MINKAGSAYRLGQPFIPTRANPIRLINVSPSSKDRLAVALDFPTAKAALNLVDQLSGTCQWFKVGMELYYAAGNSIVEDLRNRGFNVFLDLKLHDIPNTVAGGVRSATQAGASLLTIHASGGPAMMAAAAEAATAYGSPRLLAVTVLTSMDVTQLNATGVSSTPAEQVLRLAKLAQKSGVHGLVSSAEEVSTLRAELGDNALLVIPGIRPAGSDIGDQKRIATPRTAIEHGASMLVVGRPITQAADPAGVTEAILQEIDAAS